MALRGTSLYLSSLDWFQLCDLINEQCQRYQADRIKLNGAKLSLIGAKSSKVSEVWNAASCVGWLGLSVLSSTEN